MKNKQTLWIILIVVLVIMVVAAVFYIIRQQSQMNDLQQQSELAKEELADEYNELFIDYEGVRIRISNDSLLARLETEQMKVQRLQEELRTVKATNTKRINELKKELETLKAIAKNLYLQIDSLNKINEQLTTDNRQITNRLRQANQTVSQLTNEKEQLTEIVQQASKLDASNITVIGLNKNDKQANRINDIKQIEVRFVINKNITAPRGEKTIYIRIMQPNDDVLKKSLSNVFLFEGKEINYSSKRNIEYEGEEYLVTIYWNLEETLFLGTYRVEIFADGYLIGKKSFKWDK